MRFWWS